MREVFAMLLLASCFPGCAYQMRGVPPSETSKESQLTESNTDNTEPLSIGPIEPLPPKGPPGPFPELQIGMSQDEVEETLAKYGLSKGLHSLTHRGGQTLIVYGIGKHHVAAWYDTISRRLKRYTVTEDAP